MNGYFFLSKITEKVVSGGFRAFRHPRGVVFAFPTSTSPTIRFGVFFVIIRVVLVVGAVGGGLGNDAESGDVPKAEQTVVARTGHQILTG